MAAVVSSLWPWWLMIINLHFVYAADNTMPGASVRCNNVFSLLLTSGFIPGFAEACGDDLRLTSIEGRGRC